MKIYNYTVTEKDKNSYCGMVFGENESHARKIVIKNHNLGGYDYAIQFTPVLQVNDLEYPIYENCKLIVEHLNTRVHDDSDSFADWEKG